MAQPDKLLIVDGYNVLRFGDHYQALREQQDDFDDQAFNAARDALINDVAGFAGKDYQAVVVFDAAGNRFSEGKAQSVAGVEVVFSPVDVSADSVIEERVKQTVAAGREAFVVTSDAATQWTVLGNRVTRISARAFYLEVEALSSETRDELDAVNPKYTLGDRLDPEVLRQLKERFGR
jgi:predicted RNA-binding protein with PIN domain